MLDNPDEGCVAIAEGTLADFRDTNANYLANSLSTLKIFELLHSVGRSQQFAERNCFEGLLASSYHVVLLVYEKHLKKEESSPTNWEKWT